MAFAELSWWLLIGVAWLLWQGVIWAAFAVTVLGWLVLRAARSPQAGPYRAWLLRVWARVP